MSLVKIKMLVDWEAMKLKKGQIINISEKSAKEIVGFGSAEYLNNTSIQNISLEKKVPIEKNILVQKVQSVQSNDDKIIEKAIEPEKMLVQLVPNHLNLMNQLNSLNFVEKLNNKEKVLYFLLNNKYSVNEISKLIPEISERAIYKIIKHDDNKTGLIYDGFIDIDMEDQKVNKYKLLESGYLYLKKKFDDLLLIKKKQDKIIQEQESFEKKAFDDQEKLQVYIDFLLSNYDSRIYQKKTILFDFKLFMEEHYIIAEKILDKPEEEIKWIQIAVEHINCDYKNAFISLFNIPKSCKLDIGKIRYKDFGKLVVIEGIIKQADIVKPKVTVVNFECKDCGKQINIIQNTKLLRQPSVCSCGAKGTKHFIIKNKHIRSFQRLKVEELGEELGGRSQPVDVQVFLYDRLTDYDFQNGYNPGRNIRITGILSSDFKEDDKNFKTNVLFDYVEALHVDIGEVLRDVFISDDDEVKIKKIASSKDCLSNLVKSIAPKVHGFEVQKKGLLCSLVRGGGNKRKDIHLLFIGDPGQAKTTLARNVLDLLSGSRFISGTSSTKAGLGASVVKDDFLGNWGIQAGALPLANNSIVVCDELDKMEDKDILHDALENQEINIDKAGIHTMLKCQTTLIATANPKDGRFDNFKSKIKQLELPPALISRFDIIFSFLDVVNEDNDKRLADFIINQISVDIKEEVIDRDLLRKYIFYARKINPVLSKEAKIKLSDTYVNLRSKTSEIKGVTPRQLEGMTRLSYSFAKLRLSEVVEEEDVFNAVDLVINSFKDLLAGDIDVDGINTGVTHKDKDIKKIILNLLIEKEYTRDDLLNKLTIGKEELEDFINKLKRDGDVFEPKKGILNLVK